MVKMGSPSPGHNTVRFITLNLSGESSQLNTRIHFTTRLERFHLHLIGGWGGWEAGIIVWRLEGNRSFMYGMSYIGLSEMTTTSSMTIR